MGWNPYWAWVFSVLDSQDSIKELFKCVLDAFGLLDTLPRSLSLSSGRDPQIDIIASYRIVGL